MLPLYSAPSTHGGRGVFSSVDIPAGSIIELAPVILLSAADRILIHQTCLHDYYYTWDDDSAAIALGFGSLYNHSDQANAEFELDYDFELIRFTALRDIVAGEEITTNYRVGNPEMELWFDDTKA